MLVASVLAVVAGAPAQATNTSNEHMIDTNDDGKVDSREFAGADRYDTALKLANNYAGGDLGLVSTVIIASGETLIDAVTSAGLSGYKDAPVLLTRSTGISRGVANFIEDHGVGRVVVVGGAASIPDEVLEEIEGLESEPTVDRIAGADRAATAAEVASELGGDATWCGTDESVAVVVNGSDMPAVDAIAVGPLAYALELPVLLTDADALPDATADFLMDENIERVVIVGGMGAVSADVADELSEIGVDAVQRIAGDSAAGTSVELAKLMLGDCADDVGASSSMVALVNRMATADGVASAPVLGKGIKTSGPIPVLLVGDELPAAIRDYLAGTADEVDDAKTNLTIVAIGGTAVVSEAVMEAALDAAASGPELTVALDADAGGTTFTATFSDGLDDDDQTEFEERLKDLFYVNGAPASIDEDDSTVDPAIVGISTAESTVAADATCGSAEVVTITLTHALKPGDDIEVRPTSTEFGAGGDKRTVQAASFTVPAPDRDTAGPAVEIRAVLGESDVILITNEPATVKVPAGATDTEEDATGVSVISKRRAKITTETDASGTAGMRLVVSLTLEEAFDLNDDDDTTDTGEAAGSAYALGLGDIVVLAAGAVQDDEDQPNGSRATRASVGNTTKNFKVSSIKIGSVDPNVDDDPATKKVPRVAFADTNEDGVVGVDETVFSRNASVELVSGVKISASWSGGASGAAGNGWSVTVDSSSGRTTDDPDTDAEIDVSVNSRNQIIRIRYMDGTPTIGELAAALNGSSSFADRFSASPTEGCGVADDDISEGEGTLELAGGKSSVGFTVDFNNYVKELAENGDTLRDTVLAALIKDYDDSGTENLGFVGPNRQVYFRWTTDNAAMIPGSRTGPGRGVVEVPAAVATSYQDNIDGDGDDQTTVTEDDPDESMSAASEHRVSSSRSIPVR